MTSKWLERSRHGEKPQAQTVAWSYDMEGHAQKCVERCCEVASKKVEQLYKTKPDEDDGFGYPIPSCREHTLPRAHTHNPELVTEVHIVKILDNFGLDIAIPSPNNPKRTSFGSDIQRKGSTRRRELHVPNVRRALTSAALLSEHENAKESEPCLAKSKTSTQENGGASNPLAETGCGPCQLFSQPSVLHTKNQTYDGKEMENFSYLFVVQRRISCNSDLPNGYKIGASLWSRRTTMWCSSSLGHDNAEIAGSVREQRST